MAGYANIEVELKGVKYTTEATDAAGILFLSILFNQEEIRFLENGQAEEARAMYMDRASSRMKHKIESIEKRKTLLNEQPDTEERQVLEKQLEAERLAVTKQLDDEISLELWQRIERSNTTRSLISKRIKELFRFAEPRPIPERLVFWFSDEDNGINLSSTDLTALFVAIVGPTLADIGEKTKSNNAQAEVAAPATALAAEILPSRTPQEPAPKPVPNADVDAALESFRNRRIDKENVASVPNVAVDITALQEERAAITNLMSSNPSTELRSALASQIQNIDAQIANASKPITATAIAPA